MMKMWQISASALKAYIPFSVFRRRIKRQVDLLEKSKLFDRSYYLLQAQDIGIQLSPQRAVWHYVMVGDKLRLSPHRIFDTHYYHEAYTDIEGSGISALYHYITHGAQENRNPHPAFDTSYVKSQTKLTTNPLIDYVESKPGSLNPHKMFDEAYVLHQLSKSHSLTRTVLEEYFEADKNVEPSKQFNAEQYFDRYPGIKNIHPFYHYVRWGIKERRIITGKHDSIDMIKEKIQKMDDLEPDLLKPWQDIDAIGRLNRIVIDSSEESSLVKLYESVRYTGETFIIMMNSLVAGGAEKVAANFSNILSEFDEIKNIIIIVTGYGPRDAIKWFKGSKHVFVDLSDEFSSMNDNSAALMIATFMQLINVRGLLVINSRQGWGLAERHGKVLSRQCSIIVACFCYDYDVYGRRAGYARTHLVHAISSVSHVITDNHAFRSAIIKDLKLDETDAAKVKVVYQPVGIANAPIKATRQQINRKRVLWAGRFSIQKRLDLAFEIAKLMPEIDFVFAGGDLTDVGLPTSQIPLNCTIYGKYEDIDEVLLGEYDAFLYTAKWDGLPNILLEVAVNCVPIIAPNIGGISELVTDETGWIVEKPDEPQSYVQNLQNALNKTSQAAQKASATLELIKNRHSYESFKDIVTGAFFEKVKR